MIPQRPNGPRGGCEVLRVLAGVTSVLSLALPRKAVLGSSVMKEIKEIKFLLKRWREALAGVSISSGPPSLSQIPPPVSLNTFKHAGTKKLKITFTFTHVVLDKELTTLTHKKQQQLTVTPSV